VDSFEGKIAVVTGGGSGMGRELVRQLAADGCHVATCDVSGPDADDTRVLALDGAPAGTRVTTAVADVSDRAAVASFRDAVAREHATDHVDLLFNNAGIGGGGSFVSDGEDEWDKTFAVCWGGVYHCTREFLPLLLESSAGHVVNTSSVNGFWASLGPGFPHTAYSAAKFAVKGFSEALITDFRVNAPHLRVSVVMPGHIATNVVLNSFREHGRDPKTMTAEVADQIRRDLVRRGLPAEGASDEDIRTLLQVQGESFRDLAPTSAAEAATTILDGVRADRWRILVGDDAEQLDRAVRDAPAEAYEPDFFQRIRGAGVFSALTLPVEGP